MVVTNVEIADVVRSVVGQLEPEVSAWKIILFGSYAGGLPKKWSDIDIAIVSPSFSGVPLWRRQEILAERLRDADVRLSPLGYSPEEFAEPGRHSFLREIIRTGRVVYEAPSQ